MKISLIIFFGIFPLVFFSQTLSNSDIKKFAKQSSKEFSGQSFGNDIILRKCLSVGRTLIYQYDVPDYWQAPVDMKKVLISNIKAVGTAKFYFLNEIDVDFQYFKGNSIVKKIRVVSDEFSSYTFKLGKFISLKNHPKSKGVNLKLKAPIGWDVKEGDLPNTIKKFVKEGNTYSILIDERETFYSRRQNKELLESDNFLHEFNLEISSALKNQEIIEKSIVTVDSYPTAYSKVKGKKEISGIEIPMIMKFWIVFYEDKLVFLQAGGLDDNEFKALEKLYLMITNSVVFPDQYN